jgi:xanthine dehydrogenase accessory factor
MIDDVRPALEGVLREGRPAGLATIIAVEGGNPRPAGAQMVIDGEEFFGFLSGGCIEADVVLHARLALKDGAPVQLVYGQGSQFPDIRLPCGGRVEVLVERIDPEDEAARGLFAAAAERRAAIWSTNGRTRVCLDPRADSPGLERPRPTALRADPFLFARLCEPAQRLIVIGADPIALATAQLGAAAGMETHLVRPLGPPAPPPIAGIGYHRGEPGEALGAIGLDPWTAVAVATHDAGLDDEALLVALASPAGYVGALGARRRLAARLERLAARGLSPEQLARLKAPIGLPIGARSPWAIAVSIIGEVLQQAAQARQA